MDDIAARTRTTKPAIYYHFHSEEELYTAVLEAAYAGMREVEQGLELDGLPAAEAMQRLVEVSFDYHAEHPDWVRLVSIENTHEAGQRNAAVIGVLRGLLDRGVREGVFRAGIDPLDLHLMISSLCFHRVSNRHTWAAIFKRDLRAAEHVAAQRVMVVEAVLRYLQA